MNELAKQTAGSRSFYTFRVDERLYGVDVALLREISPILPMSPVPPCPPLICGIANLRSRVLLVIDARVILGLTPSQHSPQTRLIVFKPEVAEDFALLVNDIGDILSIHDLQVNAGGAPSGPEGSHQEQDMHRLVTATCQLENELLVIIDPTRLEGVVAAILGSGETNNTIGEVLR